jgi:hypothetical protein
MIAIVHANAQDRQISEKQKLIQRYLELTGGKETASRVLEAALAFQEVQSKKLLDTMIEDDSNLSESAKFEAKRQTQQSVDSLSERIASFYSSEMKLDAALDEIIQTIYEKHFTTDDLKKMVKFYQSAAGKKVIDTAPELMYGMMKGFEEKVLPKLQDFVRRSTEEEFQNLKRRVTLPRSNPSVIN